MKRLILASTIVIAAGCSSGRTQHTTTDHVYPPTSQQASSIGPTGAEGPTGSRGARGQVGQTGEAGYAVAGPRGQAGPTGAIGAQGATGARGPAGEVAVGPTGAVGPAGQAGPQGAMGPTGPRGASADGYAGAAGVAGQTGATGSVGPTGERGQTLVGPAGPAGRPGPAGERGEVGPTGSRGSTTAGVAGQAGVAGPTGPQGAAGPTGPRGPVGIIDRWTMYREFWFDTDQAAVQGADVNKAQEIAAYLGQNPSLQVGIDSSINPQGATDRQRDLATRRGNSVRDALTAAGLSASRISQGEFGNANDRRTNRVGLLIKTDPNHQAGQDLQRQSDQADARDTVEPRTLYREFLFDADEVAIDRVDAAKVAQIANYMKQNPSHHVRLNGSSDPRATDSRHLELSDQRVKTIREALIEAGVPADRISGGASHDAALRRDSRVEVFVGSEQIVREQ